MASIMESDPIEGEPEVDPPRTSPRCPTRAARRAIPKGVMLTHYNLVANIVQNQTPIQIKEPTSSSACCPFFTSTACR
jgi:hypothetical protein